MKLQAVHASETLVSQISSACDSISKQYQALTAFINLKSENAEMFEKYNTASQAILEYYHDKRTFATALLGAAKRVENGQGKPVVTPAGGATAPPASWS